MGYKVAIRKNDTGEIRFHEVEWDWFKNGEDGDHYWWTDGSFGCDCNRRDSWFAAGGEEPPDDEQPCGDVAYAALYAELPDGTKIPLDDAPRPTAPPPLTSQYLWLGDTPPTGAPP